MEQNLGKIKEGNKWKRSALAVVCLCMIFMLGTPTILAAKSSVLDNIIHAFSSFSGKKQELTQEQTNVYEQYGCALDQELTFSCGTVKLKAMI